MNSPAYRQLTGTVLCGGQSLRMGSDKGLLRRGRTTWARLAAGKLLAAGCDSIVCSVNQEQLQTYQSEFTSDQLIVDALAVPGPLKGILSIHRLFPDDDLLILACDLPDMKVATLEYLISQYRLHAGFNFYHYEFEGRKEPLCTIFRKEALSALLSLWESGELNDFKLQHVLKKEESFSILGGDALSFKNINSADEF